ncbi:amidohydrolase family protein [Acuticoccus mangrovi]|uniref:Amidohydrolase family protein n=1 Tax=Acuticoccus mangrovi TaxID=2796142 RepID=A0A934IEQ5_9HYPH|nr:amidohydrolase family protein [Acuticoccus mangrovi]MBJ3775173.1 amidohydrolase family protein [Acuticoccus mangrovi]
MRIVDAHHHIWRRTDLPWLLGPTQPRIFGAYDAIKRDYLIEEYLADIAGSGVEKSVYVQANWAPNWFVDEVAWVSGVAGRTGWPHAITAYANMMQEDARRDLDKLAAFPLMRGIRHQMHWHHNPLYRFAPDAEAVGSDAVIRNVGHLADYGFVFELQVFAGQAEAAARLVEACPEVTFVLQHAGMPENLSAEGKAQWRERIGTLARLPNVVCKVSGFGTFLRRNDPDHVAWAFGEAIDLFGAERCLFGSNFPIEKLWTDYASLIGAFTTAASPLSKEDRQSVFRTCAEKVYRLTAT